MLDRPAIEMLGEPPEQLALRLVSRELADERAILSIRAEFLWLRPRVLHWLPSHPAVRARK